MTNLFTLGIKHYPGIKMPLNIFSFEENKDLLKLEDRFKIILFLEGTALIRSGNNSRMVHAPSLICLDEKTDYNLEYKKNPQIFCITFHPEIINTNFNFDNMDEEKGFSNSDSHDLFSLAPFLEYQSIDDQIMTPGPREFFRIKELFKNIKLLLTQQDDFYWPCKSRSYLMELLFLIRKIHINMLDKNVSDEAGSLGNDFITEVVLYLHSNYYHKITIEDISKEFSTNRTTISKLFKDSLGESLISYLKKIRMQIAGKIIRDTSCTFQEVAQRVGYKDMSHFGRHFKNFYRKNPSEYRSLYNKT